jgi:hypothetical protein
MSLTQFTIDITVLSEDAVNIPFNHATTMRPADSLSNFWLLFCSLHPVPSHYSANSNVQP